MDTLKNSLSSIDWSIVSTGDDVNQCYNLFINTLIENIDQPIPLKEVVIPAKQFICEPWLTKGLLKCSKKQLQLYEKSLKSGNNDDILTYKKYRTTLQRVKRNSKKLYYISQCTKFKSDSKRLWHAINNIIKKTNNKSYIIDHIKVDNIVINNANEISNAFGKYFATIGLSVSTKGGNSKTPINEYLEKIPFQDKSVFLLPCSKSEIKKLIADLPNKSSSGHDNITNKLLKEICDLLIDPLHHIFNLSISTGIFPEDMKLADISPLFKGGNRHMLNNYRPISLLPTISKLLEKIIYARTYNFLDQKKILYNTQYGFHKKHSCEHAVTELTGEICKGLENGKHILAMYIDLSKAFDTIKHEVLYKKMYCYGIHGIALDWYKSYLTDRHIRAKCNCSTTSHVNY